MNLFKRIPTHQKPQNTLADAPSSIRSGNHEGLVHRIQANDGFGRRGAEMQVDAMASALRESSGPRRTLHLPGFYRAAKKPVAKVPS